MRTAVHPGLYDVAADHPTLSGTRCAECGRVYFPPLAIGCEACGAPEQQLRPIPVAAHGTIHSLAEVHLHQGKSPVPFTITEIQLDDGPLIRALLARDEHQARIGDTVSAVWAVTEGQDGDELVEPVFTRTPPVTGARKGANS